MGHKAEDLTGRQFIYKNLGILTVIRKAKRYGSSELKTAWECRMEDGNIRVVQSRNLKLKPEVKPQQEENGKESRE